MRVVAGPEKKTRVMGEKERLITAYHEMGHAIVGHYLEHSDPVHKVSIISRGQALGLHDLAADRGQVPHHRARSCTDTMAMTLGGRAAEEIVFSRDHHRRVERPREGHRDRQADGHALRHEREARPARVRPRPRPAVPRPRVLRRAGLLGRDRARDRRRDPPHRRGRAPAGQGHPAPSTASAEDDLRDPAQARDDRARGVRGAARRQVRGGGLRGPDGSCPAGAGAARAPRRRSPGRERPRARSRARPGRRRRRDAAASTPGPEKPGPRSSRECGPESCARKVAISVTAAPT